MKISNQKFMLRQLKEEYEADILFDKNLDHPYPTFEQWLEERDLLEDQ